MYRWLFVIFVLLGLLGCSYPTTPYVDLMEQRATQRHTSGIETLSSQHVALAEAVAPEKVDEMETLMTAHLQLVRELDEARQIRVEWESNFANQFRDGLAKIPGLVVELVGENNEKGSEGLVGLGEAEGPMSAAIAVASMLGLNQRKKNQATSAELAEAKARADNADRIARVNAPPPPTPEVI